MTHTSDFITRRGFLLWATALLLCGAGIMSLTWGLAGHRTRATDAVPATKAPHGVAADALDWSNDGMSLDAALATSGLSISMPSSSVVGLPTKIVLDETSQDERGRCGVMILFTSGIKLKVAPGETDLQARYDAKGADPFTDGRKMPFEFAMVGSRKALLLRNGVQRPLHGEDSPVRSRVTWNMNGLTYVLEGASDDAPVQRLVDAATSITH